MGLSSNEFLLLMIRKEVPFLFLFFCSFFWSFFFIYLFSHLLSFSCFLYVLFLGTPWVLGGWRDFTGERGSLFKGISLMKMSQYY